MRTHLLWAASALRGRFRKNNKLFHEQRLAPYFLWAPPSPHSHTPRPSSDLCSHLCWAPASRSKACLRLGATAARTLQPPPWIRLPSLNSDTYNSQQEVKKISKDNSVSATVSEICLKLVSRCQIIQGRVREGQTYRKHDYI